MMFFILVQKVSLNFGYYLKNICQKDLSKIAQSGHSGHRHCDQLATFLQYMAIKNSAKYVQYIDNQKSCNKHLLKTKCK